MKYIQILLVVLSLPVLASCNEKDELDKADQFYNQQEYDKAIVAYNEYLEMQPADKIAIYNRGRAYEELGEYDEALKDFKKVIKMDPNNVNAHLSYGKYYFRDKDYENAAFQFEKAFKINTSSTRSATLLARALHKAGEVQKAMEYYDIAINIDKKNGEAYLYRGALKIHLNQSSGCTDIKIARNLDYEGAAEFYDKYCK